MHEIDDISNIKIIEKKDYDKGCKAKGNDCKRHSRIRY